MRAARALICALALAGGLGAAFVLVPHVVQQLRFPSVYAHALLTGSPPARPPHAAALRASGGGFTALGDVVASRPTLAHDSPQPG